MDIIFHNFGIHSFKIKSFETQEDNRQTRPTPLDPFHKTPDTDGPKRPEVERPDKNELLKRMRRVDPDLAKKYRQRSGE